MSETTTQPGPANTKRPDLASRARKSSIATLVGYGSANVLRLGSNILLSYLLFPEDFGTMALVLTFLVGLQMFSDVGVGAAIVRSPRGDDPRFLDTAFTVQAIRGGLLWIAALALAPGFAWIYETPKLADYVRVAALQAVFAGFYSTRIYTAERSLALVRKVVCDVAAQALAIVVMLALAAAWRNVWALVVGGLVQPLAVMTLSHTVLRGHRDRLRIDRSSLGELITFGRWVFVSTLLAFLALHMDRLLLGKIDELGVLGVYNIALGLVTMPQILGGTLIGTVLYPVLAEITRESRATLAERFARLRGLTISAARLALLAIALGAPPFFRILYADTFHDAAWIAPLLVAPVWIAVLQLSADRACLALGEPRVLAASNLASMLVKAGAALAGFHLFGLIGFIGGLTIGTAAGHAVVQRALARHGLRIVRQDLRATALLLALAVPAGLLPHALAGAFGPALSIGLAGHARSATEIALALVVLVPVGWRFARQTLPALRAARA